VKVEKLVKPLEEITGISNESEQAGHRYLQSIIKRIGENYGFVATLEKEVFGGIGKIDVALKNESCKIACEIADTNPTQFLLLKFRCVCPIISVEIWERANNFLGNPKITKQPVNLFASLACCVCGGKMIVPGSLKKYVCLDCRHKLGVDDLEEILASQLAGIAVGGSASSDVQTLSDCWQYLTLKEKRIIIEQIINKIFIGKTEINIEFACKANSFKTPTFSQQSVKGNETPKIESIQSNQPILNEPLMNEIEAAKYLGISRMTLLRRRNAGEIGFYRVGFRVLYSKEKHLIPFLNNCEK